jgi:hypothetical protein
LPITGGMMGLLVIKNKSVFETSENIEIEDFFKVIKSLSSLLENHFVLLFIF